MYRGRRLILHLLAAVAILLTLPRALWAQQDLVRAQVKAASDNALSALRQEVLAARITPNLTVADFLDRTNARELLDETLARAEQIGGPRWLDEKTCQVKLEISGQRVAYALVSIAATRPRLSPMPAAAMEQRLRDWRDRTFSGTGTSVSPERIQGIRPPGGASADAWHAIDDAARGQAILAAREDANRRVLDSIRSIELAPGQTVGDALAQQPVREAVNQWLASRPVTEVRFRDNLQVEVQTAASPDELFNTIVSAARNAPQTRLPADEAELSVIRQQFAQRMASPTGQASVAPATAPATQQAASAPRPTAARIDLPEQPPAWVFQPLDVEAVASPDQSGLRIGPPGSAAVQVAPRGLSLSEQRRRTRTAAEARATDALRARVGALPLTPKLSIADAAAQDPRIADAVERVLLRARVYKTEYRADQSVMVRMMIDPRDLWFELRDAVD
ncbi:hypothetical protein [Fontivita pretiosa]|uniref:hypothetical protein n=1 Tax=Fontivita pretiosa TaxID=2989684 RepID=UPI003D186FEE